VFMTADLFRMASIDESRNLLIDGRAIESDKEEPVLETRYCVPYYQRFRRTRIRLLDLEPVRSPHLHGPRWTWRRSTTAPKCVGAGTGPRVLTRDGKGNMPVSQ
jgi:hypothetical protein